MLEQWTKYRGKRDTSKEETSETEGVRTMDNVQRLNNICGRIVDG